MHDVSIYKLVKSNKEEMVSWWELRGHVGNLVKVKKIIIFKLLQASTLKHKIT